MAKGPEKNTKNKSLHSKLMSQKKNRIQKEKQARAERLKAVVKKMNEQKREMS